MISCTDLFYSVQLLSHTITYVRLQISMPAGEPGYHTPGIGFPCGYLLPHKFNFHYATIAVKLNVPIGSFGLTNIIFALSDRGAPRFVPNVLIYFQWSIASFRWRHIRLVLMRNGTLTFHSNLTTERRWRPLMRFRREVCETLTPHTSLLVHVVRNI